MILRALRPFAAARKPIRCKPMPTFRSRPCCRTLVSATRVQFGQPIHETHPHLIAPADLTPGIPALEYHYRRAALAEKLPKNSIAILAANELKYKSGAVFYEYHQDPNFFYLTGFNEPDALAIIEKGSSPVEYTFHLHLRAKDPKAELWDGARSGLQAAQDIFNADEARDIASSSSTSTLRDLIASAKEVYTDIGTDVGRRSSVAKLVQGKGTGVEGFQSLLASSTVRPLRPLMNDLRIIKSSSELTNLRRAGAISGEVLTAAMSRPQHSEAQLWADLSYGYRSAGLDGEAYVPVVAGGKNGLSIHYTRNDALLREGRTVLVDAGGAYGGYIADITRVFPVNGRFSLAQLELYAMVLGVQKKVIALCRESSGTSLDGLHSTTESLLTSGLKDLGFDLSSSGLDLLFPHHVGHFIGLDVHDAPGYPRTGKLKKGMCVTVEPGIYVPDDERWPKQFRGLAVRVEDSIVVGQEVEEVLTGTAVKEVNEIEGLRA
ncbi:hypothetical protein B0A48_01487 [Cryoendolithus antarcticus]|uniref:Xaa-Pro aminopeptidase n=1 Tax=Cryoendolithus antarcticus TaxID=1507870 RepID=A0A1V8TPF2_9PEZI|nr:hypothetical protein B0A48_01487 [Cryoendolithus antarcticus]